MAGMLKDVLMPGYRYKYDAGMLCGGLVYFGKSFFGVCSIENKFGVHLS